MIRRVGLISVTFALLLSLLPLISDRLHAWQDTFNEDIRLRAMPEQLVNQEEEIAGFPTS